MIARIFWRMVDAVFWRDRPVNPERLVEPPTVDPDPYEEEYREKVRRRILTGEKLPPLVMAKEPKWFVVAVVK